MGDYHDWSNKIHLKIFTKRNYYLLAHISHEVQVDDDYVLVGGGGVTQYVRGGAFLTESRPNIDLKTWHVSSKDHIDSCPHQLFAYAIGMKIDGVTPAYLRSKMRVFSKESAVANHPRTHVSIPNNYLLIGGGAEVKYNGNGNLLVSSYPGTDSSGNLNSWHVKSKDHQIADRATIKAYAIGIENISFPNIGYIETRLRGKSIPSSGGHGGRLRSECDVYPKCAMTCPGGKSDFSGEGRMLTGINPKYRTRGEAYSTDHMRESRGFVSASVLGIKKRQ